MLSSSSSEKSMRNSEGVLFCSSTSALLKKTFGVPVSTQSAGSKLASVEVGRETSGIEGKARGLLVVGEVGDVSWKTVGEAAGLTAVDESVGVAIREVGGVWETDSGPPDGDASCGVSVKSVSVSFLNKTKILNRNFYECHYIQNRYYHKKSKKITCDGSSRSVWGIIYTLLRPTAFFNS